MDTEQNPKKTYALVVGIEKYSNLPENTWLDGPARNAVDFTKWLLEKEVSPDNIGLFISPLDINYSLIEEADLIDINQEATSTNINNYIKNKIYNKSEEGDLLYIFWGSHGNTNTAEGKLEQILLYSDYSEESPEHLSFDLLYTALKIPLARQGFKQQIYIIDACREYYDSEQGYETFRINFKPKGKKNIKYQFILYATLQGDVAQNKQGTGIFSYEVLKALESYPLMPDMDALAKKVAGNLEQNKQEISVDCTDWLGNKSPLLRIDRKKEQKQDWGNSPAVDVFFGRDEELNTLEKWIIEDNCRLVAIIGMGGIGKTQLSLSLKFSEGGIGKTDLSLTFAKKIQDKFEYIIWRSLRTAPSVEDVLEDLIEFLSNQEEINLPNKVEDKVSLLLQYLQAKRCLLILDNVERILKGGDCAGEYLEGYEGYGEMFRQVGQRKHQSCLLITSRETPQDISQLEGEKLPVRVFLLSGLEESAARQIFTKIASFSGSDEEWTRIIKLYDGNPLVLQIVARYIRDQCGRNVSEFLKGKDRIFGNIGELLDWHFQRFSSYEKEVMYWLAINQEPISNLELRDDILSQKSKENISGTLLSLEQRLPIERRNDARLTLQPVLIEYMTDRFVEEVCDEIKTEKISLFKSHALLKTQTADYVRETQKRLILKPLVDQFKDSELYIEDQLDKILKNLRPTQSRKKPKRPKPSYAAGNIINLFCYLGIDLTDYDFSHLAVWQADLQGINLHKVNFGYSDLKKSVFTETFGSVVSAAFSPNSNEKLLAVGDVDGEIRLWQVVANQHILILTCKIFFQGHIDWIQSVAFSADGKILSSCSNDRTVRLWDLKKKICFKILKEHKKRVWSVSFSKENILASGSADKTIKLWDVTDFNNVKYLTTLEGHIDSIWSVSFSKGNILASGSADKTIKLWDVTDFNNVKYLTTLEGHTKMVGVVAFNPQGNILVSGSDDKTIRLWDVTDVNNVKCLKFLEGHTDWVGGVIFNPQGNILASGSGDKTIRLWDVTDVNNVKCLKILEGHTDWIRVVTFNPQGNILASGSADKTIRLWDVTDVNNVKCLKILEGHTNGIWSVAFSPDGQTIASGSEDHAIRMWNSLTNKKFPNNVLQKHISRVRSVAFSPQGNILASSSDDRTVILWKIANSKCQYRKVLKGHTSSIWSVVFSPHDNNILASCGEDKRVILWNVETDHPLKILEDHTQWVWSVAFSPQGNILASGSDDTTVRLWDVTDINNVKCLTVLEGHTNGIWSLAFSPQGNILASGSNDTTVRLWDVTDVNDVKCLKILEDHTKGVWSLAFNPQDNNILASGSKDETIKIWNIMTYECLKTLRPRRPYEGMNINEINGLTEAQKKTLRAFGAVEEEE